jgi:hypothetical protein
MPHHTHTQWHATNKLCVHPPRAQHTNTDDWSQLKGLEVIRLDQNQLKGALPASWAALPSLRRLTLWDNRLEGGIPASWSDMKALEVLDLSYNKVWLGAACGVGKPRHSRVCCCGTVCSGTAHAMCMCAAACTARKSTRPPRASARVSRTTHAMHHALCLCCNHCLCVCLHRMPRTRHARAMHVPCTRSCPGRCRLPSSTWCPCSS